MPATVSPIMIRSFHHYRHLHLLPALPARPGLGPAARTRCLSSQHKTRTTPDSLPFVLNPSYLTHQVWGANTDVGKTILATVLCRSATLAGYNTSYLKPVQTGYPADSDARHVASYAPDVAHATVLHTFKDPVSPHRAAYIESRSLPDSCVLSDTVHTLTQWCSSHRQQRQTQQHQHQRPQHHLGWAFVETAGGVMSPTCSGSLQVDAYRALRLPAILIGDSKLGGISTTLTSAATLHARGYDVDLMLLFSGPDENHLILSQHGPQPNHTGIFTIPPPPPKISTDPAADARQLHEYYRWVTESTDNSGGRDAIKHLQHLHAQRLAAIDSLRSKARDLIWYPFTQHAALGDIQVVDSAYADTYTIANCAAGSSTNTKAGAGGVRNLYDAPASWWTQTLGHGHPGLASAAAHAAGRYGHIIFPETAHAPAVLLAANILDRLVPDAMRAEQGGRVFFTDNGSTATEVAMKMALHWTQAQMRAPPKSPLVMVGAHGSYHGDTMGAMDMCAPSVFNERVPWYKPKGRWLEPPTVAWVKGGRLVVRVPGSLNHDGRDLEAEVDVKEGWTTKALFSESRLDSDPLAYIYQRAVCAFLEVHGQDGIGAVMVEPVMQGAGGMLWIDPLFTRVLVREVRKGDWNPFRHAGWNGRVPIVYDEVFTGCWRLGPSSVSRLLEQPDIVCYAKSLTGGLLPLAATCATDAIFSSFLGKDKAQALLHGHSYTANPVACAVANATFEHMRTLSQYDAESHAVKSVWDHDVRGQDMIKWLTDREGVKGVVAMGTVVAVEVDVGAAGYNASHAGIIKHVVQACRDRGVYLRPLGNVVYVMASHTTAWDEVLRVTEIMGEEVERAFTIGAETRAPVDNGLAFIV